MAACADSICTCNGSMRRRDCCSIIALDIETVRGWLRDAIAGDDVRVVGAHQCVLARVQPRAACRCGEARRADRGEQCAGEFDATVAREIVRLRTRCAAGKARRHVRAVSSSASRAASRIRRCAVRRSRSAMSPKARSGTSRSSTANASCGRTRNSSKASSKQLLKRGLARRGVESIDANVPLSRIGDFQAAFFTNSAQPVRFIASIDDVAFSADERLATLLAACYDSNPPQRI